MREMWDDRTTTSRPRSSRAGRRAAQKGGILGAAAAALDYGAISASAHWQQRQRQPRYHPRQPQALQEPQQNCTRGQRRATDTTVSGNTDTRH